jgi:hypothetical protein
MTRRSVAVALLVAVPLALPPAGPAAGQQQGTTYTLAQVQSKYRRMNIVHIQKCDYDGNDVFTRTEMICVQNIYRVMYLNDN